MIRTSSCLFNGVSVALRFYPDGGADANASAHYNTKPSDETIAAFRRALPMPPKGRIWEAYTYRPSNPYGWGVALPYVLTARAEVFNIKSVSGAELAGINHSDAPDYVDVYVDGAHYTERSGTVRPMDARELESLSDDRDFVSNLLDKVLH